MTAKFQRRIIAVRGDTQGGHAGGLLNPETLLPVIEIDKSGKEVVAGHRHPDISPLQRRLWKWHEQDRSSILKLAGADPITFLEMGDLTQGNKFIDDLQETNLSAQVIYSLWSMKPWMDMPAVKSAYIVKGTGVHVWGDGSTETILTALLKAEYPRKPVQITDHWLLDVDGFTIDVAHHGASPGIRSWTRGNVLELYSRSILMDDLDLGRTPPAALLRAHQHEFTYRRVIHQVGGRIWEMPAWIVPPYCFIGSHAQKVMRSPSRMGVGLLALEIINGKLYDWHAFTHYVDLRTREVIE